MLSMWYPPLAHSSRAYAGSIERSKGDEYPIGDKKDSLYPSTASQLRQGHRRVTEKSMSYQLDFASMMR